MRSFVLSAILSVSRITHERRNGRPPNMEVTGKGWPSRSEHERRNGRPPNMEVTGKGWPSLQK